MSDERMPKSAEERFALMHATHGDYRKLAVLVRHNWPLGDRSRELIADFLETATPERSAGHPRPWPQVKRDQWIATRYVSLRSCGKSAVDAREIIAGEEGISADRVKQIVTVEKRRFRHFFEASKDAG